MDKLDIETFKKAYEGRQNPATGSRAQA